jgi:hypothetical protein
LNPASNRNILNRPGIGSLCHQHFRDIFSDPKDFIRVSMDDHAFSCFEGAGSGNFRSAPLLQLNDTESAGSDRRQASNMTEMGNADAVIEGGVENRCSSGHFDSGSVDPNVDEFLLRFSRRLAL